GHRALRIRQMLEAQPKFTVEDFARMHQDVLSLRAVEGTPHLLAALADVRDERVARALGYLRAWDQRMETHSVGASLFDTFFRYWSERVARERFPAEMVALMAGALGGLALGSLREDDAGCFAQSHRCGAMRAACVQAVDDPAQRVGTA